MDITQLNAEIQKMIDESPEKALQNVLDFLRKVRSSSVEKEDASQHATSTDMNDPTLMHKLGQ